MSSRATKRHPRERLTVSNGMLKTAAAGLVVRELPVLRDVDTIDDVRVE